MKKVSIFILILLGLSLGIKSVYATEYSPHYLPGGKNYLSSDNFFFNGTQLINSEAFTIKAHTQYCISFPREFYDSGIITWSMTFYENEDEIDTISLDSYNLFVMNSEPYYGYYSFMSPANANYISLTINENNDYLRFNNIGGIMLEEGNQFTTYEAYVPGNMIDINGPYFNGNGVVIVNVDHPINVSEITSGLVAYDAIEGDVTHRITIVDDPYTDNKNTTGEYIIEYIVSDTSGNLTRFFIVVKVVDVTAPIITGTNEIILAYPNTITIDAIKANLFASDNVDGSITNKIQLLEENYLSNQAILGNYEVVFTIIDLAGNRNYFTVDVFVVDQSKPIFYGPESFTVGYDSSLTTADVKASQTVLDDYDQDLTASITIKTDLYTPNLKKIGVYPIVFKVVDSSGNTTEKVVNVQVTDGIGPVVYLDTSIIMVYDSTVLSLADFTTLLIKSGELNGLQNYEVQIRFDSYTARANTPGVYHMTLDFNNDSGITELTKTLQIVVRKQPTGYQYEVPNIDFDNEKPEQIFIFQYWQYFAGGFVLLLTIASNVIWLLMYRKK
jgi:hypothetical protein